MLSWAIGFAVSIVVMLSATPLFIEESGGMREMIANFPDAIREAMGIDPDSFFSVVGFYSYIFLYISLAAAIQAMSLGLNIISKETRMKTADFLLSKPRSRTGIFLQKGLCALCVLAVTEAVFFAAAALSLYYQSKGAFAFTPFLLISLTFFFTQLLFFALGLFLAVAAGKIKSTLALTMGVCFGAFMLGMICAITGSGVIRVFSPLRYFDNNYIMLHHAYEMNYLFAAIALTLILTAASLILYVKFPK